MQFINGKGEFFKKFKPQNKKREQRKHIKTKNVVLKLEICKKILILHKEIRRVNRE